MNEQQQELYEKLLKKVNEYCLGYAAEDVIEAIDALVDNYETPKEDSIIRNEYYLGTEKVSQQVYETIQMYKQLLKTYQDSIKVLEIIKEKILDMDYFNVIADRCDLTYQEYELLRKVLKWKH